MRIFLRANPVFLEDYVMKHVDQDRLERWLIRKTRKLKIKAGKKPSSSLDHENNKQSGKRPVLIWDNVNSTVIWSNEQLKYFSVCSLYISKWRNFIHFFYTDPHRPSLSKWKVSKPNDITVCTYMCSFFVIWGIRYPSLVCEATSFDIWNCRTRNIDI